MSEGAVKEVPLKPEANAEMVLRLWLPDRIFVSPLLWKKSLTLTTKVFRYILHLN